MSKLQINLALTITLAALVLLPTASALTIYVRDSTTGALLNSTINITYNQLNSYQETANIATPTGGLSTGVYYNNYETLSNGTTEGYLYVNYTKTSIATNATWQTLYGVNPTTGISNNISNYSISSNCWNAYSDRIVLRFVTRLPSFTFSGLGYSYGQCYNGSQWNAVTNGSSYTGVVPASTSGNDDINRWYDANYNTGNYFYGSGANAFKNTTAGTNGTTGAAGVIEEAIYWYHPYQQILEAAPSGTATITNASYYLVGNVTAASPGYSSVTITNLLLNSTNYTINLTTNNNVTFRVVDELTGLTINTTTSTIQLSSTVYGSNTTTTTGVATFSNITYGLYTVTYTATNYTQRSYSILLPQTTTGTVVLYLLPNSEATTVRFTITDTNNFRLTNATVYINKKNTSGTNYYLVATCTTDTQGQCVSNVQLYDTTYQFYVYYLGAFRTNSLDTIVTTTEIAISVPLNRDPLQVFYQVPQISTALTFDGTTATWTVLDSYGNTQQGCVRIYRRTGLTTQQINATCTTGAAFTISTTISNLIGDENYALGTIYVDGVQLIVDRESVPNDDLDAANNTGLVLLAVVFAIGITLAMKYSWDMTTALVMFMLSTTMFWYVGLLQLSSFALVSIGVFLMIIIARNNQ